MCIHSVVVVNIRALVLYLPGGGNWDIFEDYNNVSFPNLHTCSYKIGKISRDTCTSRAGLVNHSSKHVLCRHCYRVSKVCFEKGLMYIKANYINIYPHSL